jgi:tetratricopeptide (TPR) repeat protein
MDLDEGKHGTAERSLNRAVSLAEEQKQPPLEAYELLAALDLLRNDEKLQRGEEKGNRWLERTVAYNPRYGGAYETLAHYEVMRRKYREASGWLQKAVQVEPTRWSAQAEYGVNLLRLGEVDGARSALEKAYAGDPFSATTVNTLRVLDKLKNFSVTPARLSTLGGSAIPGASSSSNTSGMTPGTGATAGTNATRGTSATPGASPPADLVTWLDPKEADAIRPYVEQVAGDSITTFAKRYGFQPKQPVTIELYPNHDDFAVRTAGLPGIGLLGVTFGYLVAMDSPSGRAAGDFHWASTLWHEMAHVFTLSVTDHRVPRWLSEGISVFEEWRTGPTPGIAVSPRALDVFREGKFLPVATLDEGFIRPDYEDQVQVSYMQSGLICYFIEQKWGFDKLVALLRQFTKDTTTAAAVEATFKMSPKDFDKELATFLTQRFKGILENSEEWQKTMAATHVAADQKDWPNTIRNARRAIELFPDFTLDGSAYLPLARALNETGKRAEAVKALEDYRRLGGWNPTALRELATWLEEAGKAGAASEIHHALVLIEPLDGTLHAKLGQWYGALGKAADSLREYKVLLALNPHDTASANFGIARALNSLGDRAQSRRHLLEALETAPHFRPAQDLLLDLSGKPTP